MTFRTKVITIAVIANAMKVSVANHFHAERGGHRLKASLCTDEA